MRKKWPFEGMDYISITQGMKQRASTMPCPVGSQGELTQPMLWLPQLCRREWLQVTGEGYCINIYTSFESLRSQVPLEEGKAFYQ